MSMKINHYFKKRLDIPQEPPVDSWEYIQQRIPNKQEKRKPFIPIWIFASGIAASLALIGGSVYLLNQDFSNGNANTMINNSSSSTNSSMVKSDGNSPENLDGNFNSFSQDEIELNSSSDNSNNLPFNSVNQSTNSITKQSNYGINSTSFVIHNSSNSSSSDSSFGQQNETGSSEVSQTFDFEKDNSLANSSPVWTPEYADSNQVLKTILEEPKLLEKQENLVAKNQPSENKKKPIHKKKVEFDRFYVAGFISPMALNTFVGNSMLADQMSQYKTENNVLLAYGMKGGYAISPRVKLRTGVSVIGFEQITKDVPLSYQIEGSENVASHLSNNIKYHGNLRIQPHISAVNQDLTNTTGSGDIQQQSQYIEIPIEAEVALFKTNSIGISATGGGSTWLLSKNKIIAHTDDFTQELGKAKNLNNTSFSANAGLKFDMNLTDNIQLNVEPTFKYLINPVNDIKNYNPYTVGVNAGVSVSFK